MSHRRSWESRRVDEPSPGFFRIRLVKGGPWVAAEIRRGEDKVWTGLIDGKPGETSSADPAAASDVFRIWHSGEFIPEHEHAYLVQRAQWCRIHQPDSPEANPTRPIDIGRQPPAF